MLNEEKIILMTQMASYEENEGKKNMAIGRYFRSDYIAIQVLKSVLCATIAYAVCFALFIYSALAHGGDGMTEEQRVNLYDSLERISHNLEQYLAEFPSEHPPKK